MKIRNSYLIHILIVAFLLWPHSGRAEDARLSDIVVTNTRDHLLLYFSVIDCFTPELDQAVESGINTTFTFFVQLYEKRKFLWDKKIADREISHSIKYDNLKETYEVRLSEKGNEVLVVKDFDEAKKLMSEVVALEVCSLARLGKERHYRIRMMAELDKIRLPFYLHYVLFFLSLWDFETDWYTVDFRY